mgnify:CR=1 FL=1
MVLLNFQKWLTQSVQEKLKDYFQEINISCKNWVYKAEKELLEISNPKDKLNGTFDPTYQWGSLKIITKWKYFWFELKDI